MEDLVSSFFSKMESRGSVVVRDTPKLDLDLYIQNYRGRTRFERLFLIGRTSQALSVDALKAAVSEAKKGKDVRRYKKVVECLAAVAPQEPEASLDQSWVDRTEMTNRAETHRLEAELKGYKNNLIRESIRMGNEDLGRHYESIGDLSKAMEAYTRMGPDISTPKHIVDIGRHHIRVSLQRQEWALAGAYLTKMMVNQSDEDGAPQLAYQRIVHGVVLLGQEKYHDAALSFLQADPAFASTTYNEVASPNDVAVYGGLLALASMGREDLQSKVLDNPNFRTFLELELHIRRAVAQFVNGRYSACLAILESYRPDYLLDIYLQRHVHKLYGAIRRKCIVQYLIPFSCVTLESMNAAFAAPGQSIEEELVAMIRSGALQARINTIDKLVTTVSVKPRVRMQSSALETAKRYEQEAVGRLRRMSLIAADLEVKGQRKLHSGPSTLGQSILASESGFDDTPME